MITDQSMLGAMAAIQATDGNRGKELDGEGSLKQIASKNLERQTLKAKGSRGGNNSMVGHIAVPIRGLGNMDYFDGPGEVVGESLPNPAFEQHIVRKMPAVSGSGPKYLVADKAKMVSLGQARDIDAMAVVNIQGDHKMLRVDKITHTGAVLVSVPQAVLENGHNEANEEDTIQSRPMWLMPRQPVFSPVTGQLEYKDRQTIFRGDTRRRTDRMFPRVGPLTIAFQDLILLSGDPYKYVDVADNQSLITVEPMLGSHGHYAGDTGEIES